MSQHPLTSQYHQNPLPHTCARHDYLLCLQCVCVRWCLRLLRSHVETFMPVTITRFMSLRYHLHHLAHFQLAKLRRERMELRASDVCPWLFAQTMEMVNNAKTILPWNAADRRSSSWQSFLAPRQYGIYSRDLSASIIAQCCTLGGLLPLNYY